MNPKKMSLATQAAHGKKTFAYEGPVTLPIYQTSTYRFKNSNGPLRYAEGDPNVFVYSRYHNPTVQDVEEKLALMEEGEDALLFASGMAAISTTLSTFVHAGEEIISTPAIYGGTYRYFRDVLPNQGVRVKYINPRRLEEMSRKITKKTSVVYFETPTNPTLSIVDISKLVAEVRRAERKVRRKIIIIIDNTFATIFNQRPFEFGVDLIIESGTKYLGGHSDLLAGAVIGPSRYIDKVRHLAKYYGGCADPFMAFLLYRSLKTFTLRIQKQNANAFVLASELSKHPKIAKVLYPGLKSHPDYHISQKQMSGFGGILTIEVKGGLKAAVKLCDSLKVAVNAMSLGGVETLVSIPVYSSHVKMKAAELRQHGVTPGMVRISAGVEGIDDLLDDFSQALKKV
jgi:cystathionine beta-lyase/cystathionine gamma-synthase